MSPPKLPSGYCSVCKRTDLPPEMFYNSKRKSTVCRECHRDRNNKHNRYNRILVLKHYGGNPPRCRCCGESNIEFLGLDHIAGGGRQHRQTIKMRWWQWIIKNNFPPTFRVLCHNCNQSLGVYGYCPHESSRSLFDGLEAFDPNTPNRSYKLTQESVDIIRALIASGVAQCDIAKQFNVSRAIICHINKGKAWAS